jgi:hypothetical protein
VALLAASCSSHGSSAAGTGAYTGPPAHGAPHPLGAKWDWSRVNAFGPYLRQLSGGATFYEVTWCSIEPTQGARSWATVDQVARSSQALGYALYLKIRVGSCWATDAAHAAPAAGATAAERRAAKRAARRSARKAGSSMPADLSAYTGFVNELVRRYGAHGVHEYAVENEVNAAGHWLGTASDYVALVTTAAQAIRAADPTAEVADGGLGSTVYGGVLAQDLLDRGQDAEAVRVYQGYYARRFAVRGGQLPQVSTPSELRSVLAGDQMVRNRQYYDATMDLFRNGVVDVFQLHFYERWDQSPAVASLVRGRLPASVPIQAWEVGQFWPDAPNDPKVHAAETTKVVCALLEAGATRLIWLPLAYNPGGRNSSELRFGMLDPDGAPRPAGTAFLGLRNPAACPKTAA